mgnify:CR=1 FL=1
MSREINLKVHIHCSHCGNEMPIKMDKTIGINDDHMHWLVTPCECLWVQETARADAAQTTLERVHG